MHTHRKHGSISWVLSWLLRLIVRARVWERETKRWTDLCVHAMRRIREIPRRNACREGGVWGSGSLIVSTWVLTWKWSRKWSPETVNCSLGMFFASNMAPKLWLMPWASEEIWDKALEMGYVMPSATYLSTSEYSRRGERPSCACVPISLRLSLSKSVQFSCTLTVGKPLCKEGFQHAGVELSSRFLQTLLRLLFWQRWLGKPKFEGWLDWRFAPAGTP